MLLGIPYPTFQGRVTVYLIMFKCVRSTNAYRDIQVPEKTTGKKKVSKPGKQILTLDQLIESGEACRVGCTTLEV
jgi:hypothetical protein